MIAVKHLQELHILPVNVPDIRRKAESYLQIIAAAAIAFVLIISAIHSVSARFAPAPGTVKVVVHPGETLWTYAAKYGSPDVYILKRVHRIAEMNNLSAGRPLQVGQELVVPVDRIVLSAQAKRAVD